MPGYQYRNILICQNICLVAEIKLSTKRNISKCIFALVYIGKSEDFTCKMSGQVRLDEFRLSIKQERKIQYSLTTWSPQVFQPQAFLEPQGQYVCDSKPSRTSVFVPLKPKVGTFCSIPLKSIENQSNLTDLRGKEKDTQIVFLGFTTLCRTCVRLGCYWKFNSKIWPVILTRYDKNRLVG